MLRLTASTVERLQIVVLVGRDFQMERRWKGAAVVSSRTSK
jgi:hypothetical protein